MRYETLVARFWLRVRGVPQSSCRRQSRDKDKSSGVENVSQPMSKGDFCLRMRGKVKNFFYFATFVNALRERAVFGSAEFNNRTFERESFFHKSSVSHLKHVTAKSNSK